MDLPGILHELFPHMTPFQKSVFLWAVIAFVAGVYVLFFLWFGEEFAHKRWMHCTEEQDLAAIEREARLEYFLAREGYMKFKSCEIVPKQ